MRTLIIFIVLFFANNTSADISTRSLVAKKSENSFDIAIKEIETKIKDYKTRERNRAISFYMIGKGKDVLKKYVDLGMTGIGLATGSIPGGLAGSLGADIFKLGADVTVDLLGHASKSAVHESFQDEINSYIYEVYQKDKKILEEIFILEDPIEKAGEIVKEFEKLESYQSLSPKDTDERAVMNSMAISKIITMSTSLSKQVLENTSYIDTLKKSHKKFHDFMKTNKDNYKKFLNQKAIFLRKHVKHSSTQEKLTRNLASISDKAKDRVTSIYDENIIEEEDNKTLKENIDELAEDTRALAEDAKILYAIALELGLKGEDQKRVGEAVMYLDSAAKIVGGIAKGSSGDLTGYFSTSLAVIQLFGNKDPRPTAEQIRHKQIMDAFSRVLKNQYTIMENQQKILNAIVSVHENVLLIQKQLRQSYITNADNFKTAFGNQSNILEAIVDFSAISSSLKECNRFFNSRLSCNPVYLEKGGDLTRCFENIIKNGDNNFVPDSINIGDILITGNFQNYDSFKSHLENNLMSFYQCREALDEILQNETHPIFETKSHVSQSGKLTRNQEFLEPIYHPLINLVEKYFLKDNRSALALYYSLINPNYGLDNTTLKMSHILRSIRELDRALSFNLIKEALENHIDLYELEKNINYFLEASKYEVAIDENVFTPGFTIKTSDQLLSEFSKVSSNKTKQQFYSAVRLVNIAIAQHSLLSGEGILPILHTQLESGSRSYHQDAIEAIRNNRYLQINYLNYSLDKKFRFAVNSKDSNKKENYDYFMTLFENYLNNEYKNCSKIKNNEILKKYNDSCNSKFISYFGYDWNFSGKSVVFKDRNGKLVNIELPSLRDLKRRQIVQLPGLNRLFLLKEKLVYSIFKNNDVVEYALNQNYYNF